MALYEVYYLRPGSKRHMSMVVEAHDLKDAKQRVRDAEDGQDIKFLEVWMQVQQEEE